MGVFAADTPRNSNYTNKDNISNNITVQLAGEDRKTIYVSSLNDFCITNTEGQTLQYCANTEEITGDMELYRVAWTIKRNEELLVLTVPYSESYTITTSQNDMDFYVLSSDAFVGARFAELQSATIKANSEISVLSKGAIQNQTNRVTISRMVDELAVK